MSRGGRGGFRGGGGGGRRMIGGVEVNWDLDPDLQVEFGPSELFPAMKPNPAEPPTKRERAQVARYRTLRDRIHEGPLYTVLGDNVRVTKPGASRGMVYDAFEGMPTYSQRNQRVRRKIPRLDTRPYVMRYFPEELRSTLDRNYTKPDDAAATKKRLRLANTNVLSKLEEFADDEDDENRAPNEDALDDEDEDQGEAEEEQQDDEYEEDDDDENDDYNAEQYFSTGENDDMGDEDGGYGNDYD